jgi:hypothetical protein
VSDRPRVRAPLSEAATPRCPSASPLPAPLHEHLRLLHAFPLPLPRRRTSTSTPSVLPRRQPPPTSAAPLAKPPQRSSSTCTVPSPPTLAGKVPEPPCVAPHRRQLRSRQSPWTRRSSWAREPGAPGRWAGSQLGHGPPQPSVVVGRTRAVCASEPSRARALPGVVLVGLRPGFGPWPFFLFF